jgi:hypothetical protein
MEGSVMGQEIMDLRRDNAGSRGGNDGRGDSAGVNYGAARFFRERKVGSAVRLKIGDILVGKGQRREEKKHNNQQGRQIPMQKIP